MKKILFFLLFLTSFTADSQSIIGGGGRCYTDANPNTVTSLSSGFANLGYCTEVYDTVNNIHYSLNRAGTVGTDKWVAAATLKNAWSITGNAGTVAGTNFLGTTDAIDLVLMRNSIEAGYIKGTNVHVFGQSNFNRTTGTGTLNAAFGSGNFTAATSGNSNTGIGTGNFAASLTSTLCTGVGSGNFAATTSGNSNTGVGYRNFFANTTSGNNTGVGIQNFQAANGAAAILNTAVGFQNFLLSTSGTINTALGVNNFKATTTTSQNVAVGSANFLVSTAASQSVGVGIENFTTTTTGTPNFGVGYRNFYLNTAGSINVGVGYRNFYSSTTSGNHTALGQDNYYSNTTGINNVGIGNSNLFNSTTGSNNVAIGSNVQIVTTATGVTGTALAGFTVTNVTGGINISGAAIGTAITLSGGVAGDWVFQTTIPTLSTGQSAPAQIFDGTTIFRPNATVAQVAGLSLTLQIVANVSNSVGIGTTTAITKSNQVVLGGVGITEVKFRGENGLGYNYAHDVSATLSGADDGKVWTYEHSSSAIKLKSISVSSLTSAPPEGEFETIAAATTTTSYTIPVSPNIAAGTVTGRYELYLNGVRIRPGATKDYLVTSSTVSSVTFDFYATVTQPIAIGDIFYIVIK